MNNARDLALCAVAVVAVVALVVVAKVQPPAAGGIVSGIIAIGSMALGRLSGTGQKPPDPPV